MGPRTRWMDSSELASSSIHRWVSHTPSIRQSWETCLKAVWSDLNVLDTLSSECSKVVVPWCFQVALCGANQPIMHLYWQNFGEEFVLMDDNSRPHHSHLVNEFLHDKNIIWLVWPTCSPDMNPIKHAWDTLKRAVFGQDDPPTTLGDLCRIVVEEWDNLDQQDLDELMDSMPRRIKVCINARGRATGY